MDLYDSVKNFEEVINVLKSIEKFEKIDPPKEIYISKKSEEELRCKNLQSCIPILTKLKKELENEISKIDCSDYKNIEEKYKLVTERYFEAVRSIQENKEKYNLIREIEGYEKIAKQKNHKIIFNKVETENLIRNIHTNDSNYEENPEIIEIIKNNVFLNYEKIGIVETETLRIILNLLNME